MCVIVLKSKKLTNDYVDYVIVVTDFMYESLCLWIHNLLPLFFWMFEALNMSMNVGESDDWIVCRIAMIYDWHVHYNMFEYGDTDVYCSIRIMGKLNVVIIIGMIRRLVNEGDEDHVKTKNLW